MRLAGLAAAVDEVEDAVGQPALDQRLDHQPPVNPAASLGLNTTVLPATSAADIIPTDSATGKLNGAITPNTP